MFLSTLVRGIHLNIIPVVEAEARLNPRGCLISLIVVFELGVEGYVIILEEHPNIEVIIIPIGLFVNDRWRPQSRLRLCG